MATRLVSTSPHVSTNRSTKGVMRDVLIALLPALLVGVAFFGLYALFVVVLTCASCVVGEFLFNKMLKKPNTTKDLSALVTGLILGLNLPPYVPFYVPIVGGFFAIIIVKMLFGGLGRNFANPAATARVFLLLAWSSIMTKYASPVWTMEAPSFFVGFGIDAINSATPLSGGQANILQLFIGYTGGSIGETSSLALIIGGIYLIARKVIDYKIPLVIILTVLGFNMAFGLDAFNSVAGLFAGGLMIGAFFMATDYSTSPNTAAGRVVFAFIIGLVTALVRVKGSYPEGMSFAIVFANLLVPFIDRIFIPKPFGAGFDFKKVITIAVVFVLVCTLSVFPIVSYVSTFDINQTTGVVEPEVPDVPEVPLTPEEIKANMFKDEFKANSFALGGSIAEGVNFYFAYTDIGTKLVLSATSTVNGYVGPVEMYVLVDNNVVEAVAAGSHKETFPFAFEKEYLAKYIGLNLKDISGTSIDGADGKVKIDAASNATFSSAAIANAIDMIVSAYKNVRSFDYVLSNDVKISTLVFGTDRFSSFTAVGVGGYVGDVEMNVVTKNGVIESLVAGMHRETFPFAFEKEYLAKYIGLNLKDISGTSIDGADGKVKIDAASNATYSSTAIADAVDKVTTAYKKLGGKA